MSLITYQSERLASRWRLVRWEIIQSLWVFGCLLSYNYLAQQLFPRFSVAWPRLFEITAFSIVPFILWLVFPRSRFYANEIKVNEWKNWETGWSRSHFIKTPGRVSKIETVEFLTNAYFFLYRCNLICAYVGSANCYKAIQALRGCCEENSEERYSISSGDRWPQRCIRSFYGLQRLST